MTRANTEQLKHTPWFAKAGAACSIVPISRFVGPSIFALKGGGYGCLFSLTGLDEEGLTDRELESRIRQIEGALRGLPDGSCLYQYTRVMSGFDLPRQKQYDSEITETFASDRLAHLEKTAAFRRIDLHWCLTLEPSKAKAFERKPEENAVDTSRMLTDLEKTATLLEGHLGSSLGLRLQGKAEAFQFFSYLFNLEEWAARDQLRGDNGVDRQIVKSPVAWHSDHVQVGNPPYMALVIEATDESGPCGLPAISVAHYGEQSGDLMRDPEMCFELGLGGGAHLNPFYWRNDFAGIEQWSRFIRDDHYAFHAELYKQHEQFAKQWDTNHHEQGFVEAFERQQRNPRA